MPGGEHYAGLSSLNVTGESTEETIRRRKDKDVEGISQGAIKTKIKLYYHLIQCIIYTHIFFIFPYAKYYISLQLPNLRLYMHTYICIH
jgi:hypothetical protein